MIVYDNGYGVLVAADGDSRDIYPPGCDVSSAPPEVQRFAALLWTPEVIAQYMESAAREANGNG